MPTDITINPLDRRRVAIGIGLPLFTGQSSQMNLTYTTMDQAEANARNLLLTNRGERVMQPKFGCDLYRALFDNMTDAYFEVLHDRIRDQFAYWLPYISIDELDIFSNEVDQSTANKLYIKMRISLKNNQFDTRSIDLVITRNI